MEYRIEAAKTGRSSCRHCGMTIEKGSQRFGGEGQVSRWFHLACAAEGAPRAFKPFAEQAAALLADQPAMEPPKARPRDLAAEALLSQNPDDPEARAVFADYLMNNGDPWGEIIALYRADKESAAKKLIKEHAGELFGGLAPKFFEWEGGFVSSVTLEGRSPKKLREQYELLRTLPVACTIRRLALPLPPDAALVEAVCQHPLPALRELFFHYSAAVDALELPQLHELGFFVPAHPEPARKLFGASGVPGLRVLSMFSNSNPLPPDFLDALFTSNLIKQLEELKLHQGAFDDAGADRVFAHAEKIEHIERLELEIPRFRLGELHKRFPRQKKQR